MNKEEFETSIRKIYSNIDNIFFDKIETYKKILIEENKKFNLTRLDSEEKIYGEYFFESIVPYVNIDFNQYKTLLDIGSGSGIPGVLIKLLFNKLDVTIIEANQKKCLFLNHLINQLEISINVIHNRAENINKDQYESFDIVTSRAVAKLKIILELSTPYCKVDGLIIEPKSLNVEHEIEQAKKIQKALHLSLNKIDEFTSINNFHHKILFYKKNKKTLRIYPRKWNQIINE